MAEFVKKAMMGYYKDAPGGESDPECTHVILTKKEYGQLLIEKAQAEQESRNTRYDADRAIQRARVTPNARCSRSMQSPSSGCRTWSRSWPRLKRKQSISEG
jgi:hypothetical protein